MAFQTNSKNMFMTLSDSELQVTKNTECLDSMSLSDSGVTKRKINTTFESVEVVALPHTVSNQLEEFPTLGGSVKPSKKESRKIHEQNIQKLSFNKETTNKYTPNERTNAFSSLENKEELAKKLFRTRRCRNVEQNTDGTWKYCYKETCNFYHSLDEFNPPPCHFDKNCRFKYGRLNRDGTTDKKSCCSHKHTDESVDQWLKRSNQQLPDLPQTNKLTRKPKVFKEFVKPSSKYSPKLQRPTTKPVKLSFPVSVPIKQIVHSPRPPPLTKPIKTLIQEPIKLLIKEPIQQVQTTHPLKLKSIKDESEEESEDESEEEKVYKSKRKTLKQPKRIVRVPTEKLAKIALKSLFAQNIFDVKVIVEA